MAIQNWSDEIILVNLPQEPEMGEDIVTVTSMISGGQEADVVLDFAEVDIMTSSTIARLLNLRKELLDIGRRLIFVNVSPRTRKIFSVTGLECVFKFAEDQFVALATLQMANCC